MKVAFIGTAALVLLGTSAVAFAQDAPAVPTPLSALIAEAEARNPQIAAAHHAWKAAAEVPKQMTTLPDPRITVQQFSVGSPKPFAGYTNSDFAYLGIGASQELPYRGKLRLRGQVAEAEAGSQLAAIAVTSTTKTCTRSWEAWRQCAVSITGDCYTSNGTCNHIVYSG